MQTTFSLAQLADPDVAESEKILRACVHCGFCTATCPTYVLLGDELDSPRGRIYLIKDMLENDRPATQEVVKHIDRCLSCLACMTTCPSGVHYMHLVDHARAHIERTFSRPFADRMLRSLLAAVLPYRGRFRLALFGARLAKLLAPLFEAIGLKPLAAMLRLAPAHLPPSTASSAQQRTAESTRRGRVIVMQGCASDVLAPSINAAAVRLLGRHGIEVAAVENEGCCGALVHHMGREDQAFAQARRNIDAWTRVIEAGGLGAILITASGCGTTVKDYGFMFRNDPAYAAKAARVSALAKDISEYLMTLEPPPQHALDAAHQHATGASASAGSDRKLVVAYHPACSLQHGQKVVRQPKQLLAQAGFTVRDIAESHLCCGSAGTYNMLQPEIARRLRDRKVANVERTGADVIATGNIGCMTQIGQATQIPVVHTVELLDWASGGPLPGALQPMWRSPSSSQRNEIASSM